MRIDILDLRPNPYRDFVINPIDKEQVKELVKSYQDNGDFGVIPVRKNGDIYEIAVGHHRVEAMSDAGFHRIDCKVSDFSEDEMISMMIAENATQHGGKPSSQADSVCAAIQRIAYWMLISETVEEFNEFESKRHPDSSACAHALGFFGHNAAFTNAKKELLEEGTIGYRTVQKYIGDTLSGNAIRDTLPRLITSGHIKVVIEKSSIKAEEHEREIAVQVELARQKEDAKREKEQAAADKARKAAELKAQKAREAAEKAVKAAERAKEAARKAELTRKANEAKRKAAAESKAAEKEKIREQMRKEELERITEEREQQEAMAARRKREREQAEAAAKKRQLEAHIDPRVFSLMSSGKQTNAFVNAVNKFPNKWGKDVFDQVKFLNDLIASRRKFLQEKGKKILDAETDVLSEVVIEDAFLKMDKEEQERREKLKLAQRKREEARNKEAKADRIMDELCAALARLSRSYSEVHEAMKDPEISQHLLNGPHSLTVRGSLESQYRMLPELEKFFGVQARKPKAPKTVKQVNSAIRGIK